MLGWPLWFKIVVDDEIQFKLHQATSSDARPQHMPVCGCCELALSQGSHRVDVIPPPPHHRHKLQRLSETDIYYDYLITVSSDRSS